jgi:hypothetical protein
MLSSSFSDRCAPSCVQCRSQMTLALCEPDFKNPALMLATYRCEDCGLRDRAQIDTARPPQSAPSSRKQAFNRMQTEASTRLQALLRIP